MFLTDKERKKKHTYQTANLFVFTYIRDLSGVVRIKVPTNCPSATMMSEGATAVMEFSFYWLHNTYEQLNGFNGFDCVRFEYE
jgi:hypothetical protein